MLAGEGPRARVCDGHPDQSATLLRWQGLSREASRRTPVMK